MSDFDPVTFRKSLRSWLEDNWNPTFGLVEWRNILADSGWGVPHWPKEWYGKGLPIVSSTIADEEFDRIGAIGVAKVGIRLLAAATILEHGNDSQKTSFLRRILTGEDTWCQLFSEPGSGSDLAGATTRADLENNSWKINGQKVWTTSAHHADWALLLARTNWDVPKHQGLSYFIIDMHQDGIDVQPLKQMNGHASFNQVFFTDALIPKEQLLGNTGDGWKVAMTTLAHERRLSGALRRWADPVSGAGKIYEEQRHELESAMEPYKWYPQRAGRVDLVLPRAIDTSKIRDSAIRQEIAKLLILSHTADWTAHRARATQELGRPQGPEGSLGKLAGSLVAKQASIVHTLISGSDAMLSGKDGPMQGIIAEILLSVPATSIAGGTDEIQKNIIAERVLDLPKEPRLDGGPFREVPKNPVR